MPRFPHPLVLPLLLAWGCARSGEPQLPARFGPGFALGFATVGYQSEGSMRPDGGRVASNWSEWEQLGKIGAGEAGTSSKEGLFQVDFSRPDFPRTRTRSADLFSAIAHHKEIDSNLWKTWDLPSYPVGIP